MEAEWQARTELLVGAEGVALLREAHVLVVGLGGVGAMAAEVLARAGVGSMTIADGDRVQPTNLNRQLVALHSTLGRSKAEAMAQRLLDINPELKVRVVGEFLKGQLLVDLVREPYSVVVDAIDTLSPKVFLIVEAVGAGNRVVSAMGCGGKLDVSQVQTGSFWSVQNCRLASTMRKRMRHLGFKADFRAVYSTELSKAESVVHCEEEQNRKSRVGVIAYMPLLFGTLLAAEAVRIVLGEVKEKEFYHKPLVGVL